MEQDTNTHAARNKPSARAKKMSCAGTADPVGGVDIDRGRTKRTVPPRRGPVSTMLHDERQS